MCVGMSPGHKYNTPVFRLENPAYTQFRGNLNGDGVNSFQQEIWCKQDWKQLTFPTVVVCVATEALPSVSSSLGFCVYDWCTWSYVVTG